jgi:transcription antitermination factor NusG
MVLRGISRREVEDAIRKGKKRIQDRKIVATYLYFEVLYVIEDDEIRVVTVTPRW